MNERLWRVRKNNAWIDARMTGGSLDRPRVDFFYDGTCIFSREFGSRDLALDEATVKLRDLQRAGWNTHW